MSDGKSMPMELAHHVDKRQKLGDKYAEIDKQINSDGLVTGFIGHASDLSDAQLYLLLLVIGGHLENRIHFQDIERILAEHQDIKDKLQTAWKAKSYQEILQLDYLQSSSSPEVASIEQPDWPPKYLERINQLLRESWKLPYRGNYHKVLWEKINKMYGRRAYKNICAIIQSSGTGKSRMVDELAKLVYTLPINIRRRAGINAAYPPPDDVLRRYLVDQAPNNELGCRSHYEIFFRCLFSYSLEILSNLNLSDDDLAGKWYELMDQASYRSEFYEHVVKLCKSPTDNQRTLKDLVTKLHALSANQKIRMVIYIDEAHELETSCGGCTKLDILCLVISDFCVEPLFFLLLSTRLDFLVPAREATTSEPCARGTIGLLAPITETPFDCFLDDPIKPGVLRVAELSTLDRVARWGRPLWWTMVSEGADELIGLARMKLMCYHDINEHRGLMKREALIAVLDVLLAFDFEPNRELSVDVQANLVTSHMRIAYSVPQHRLYFRSGYPSEPLLAEAAAQQLLAFKPGKGGCFRIIADIADQTRLLDSTLIDVGQRGEVFVRMSLMGAYMDGVLQERRSEKEGIIFSTGCKLTTFIEQLFTPECARMILDARPDNLKSDMPFSQAFARSMIRFTHFAKAGDQYQTTSEALFGAFIRGMAFIGYQTQQAVDFVIPVLLNEEDALEESAMSAILIQVKKHVQGRGLGMYDLCEAEVGLFPLGGDEDGKGKGRTEESLDDKRPYVTLIAEVGIEPNKGYVHISPLPTSKHHADVHPRYAIAAYGCDGVYKSVDMRKHAFLLATQKFSEEHPDCQVDESRNLMMRLKPVWERGENSYHWLDSKLLKKTK